MPVTPTYPGVYIEELASGVRTITGVSTSVTAFIGPAKRGPINKAVRVLSYSDFERRFGGLSADSEMSYSVRQFFMNGGSDAWVVRIAGSASAASRTFQNAAPADVLKITALDEGLSGRNIKVVVEHNNANGTFKLVLAYTNPQDSSDSLTETFANLSMNKFNLRYVESVVNGSSSLVKVERVASPAVITGLTTGTSTSGYLTNNGESSGTLVDIVPLIDGTHAQFQVSMNGLAPVSVELVPGDAGSGTNLVKLGTLCAAIKTKVSSQPGYSGFDCVVEGSNKRIVMKSTDVDEASAVTVLPGLINDLSGRFKLGLLNGGEEVEAAATIRPALNAGAFLEGGSETPVTSGNASTSYVGSRANREGIYALESVDLFNIVCLPGVSEVSIDLSGNGSAYSGILSDVVSYCKERRAVLIVDAPSEIIDPQDMYKLIRREALTSFTNTVLPSSDYAAVYYPWIQIADPLNSGKPRLTAPSGAIAGLYARTDSTRGVWKAPAGTDATLSVLGVGYKLTDPENGTLNPQGVNCIRLMPVYGTIAWGARTLQGADDSTSEWKYVPIRRLALYIEESLYRGTKWIVFEPNDEPLWSQIRLNVGAFMNTLFRQGAFQGTSPRDAYFVKCDKETTTQDDINRGVVNILVGFAPLKPAEFVIVKIQQMAGQIQA